MAETSLPAVAFVVAYTASGSDTNTAATVAVGLAVVLTRRPARAPRVARPRAFGARRRRLRGLHRDPQRARGVLLPARPAGQRGVRLGISHLARRARRPLVGIIVTKLDGEGDEWRRDPAPRERVRARDLAVGDAVPRAVDRAAAALHRRPRSSLSASRRRRWGCRCSGSGCGSTWLLVRRHRIPAPAPDGRPGAGRRSTRLRGRHGHADRAIRHLAAWWKRATRLVVPSARRTIRRPS